jgi:hypothetical protein
MPPPIKSIAKKIEKIAADFLIDADKARQRYDKLWDIESLYRPNGKLMKANPFKDDITRIAFKEMKQKLDIDLDYDDVSKELGGFKKIFKNPVTGEVDIRKTTNDMYRRMRNHYGKANIESQSDFFKGIRNLDLDGNQLSSNDRMKEMQKYLKSIKDGGDAKLFPTDLEWQRINRDGTQYAGQTLDEFKKVAPKIGKWRTIKNGVQKVGKMGIIFPAAVIGGVVAGLYSAKREINNLRGTLPYEDSVIESPMWAENKRMAPGGRSTLGATGELALALSTTRHNPNF